MTSYGDPLEGWSGPAAACWLQVQDEMDRAFAPFGLEAEKALELRGGERVLDVGCGCGSTTLSLARIVGAQGAVTGIDISRAMLERAAERAERAGLASRISWLEHDAETADLGRSIYDAVYSRFGVMFFADPQAAFHGFAEATRASGRLAFACWQTRSKNPWFDAPARAAAAHVELVAPARDDAPGPFGLAGPERMQRLLGSAGWRGIEISCFEEPIDLGESVPEAVRLLSIIGPVGAALRQPRVSHAARQRVLDTMSDCLTQFVTPDGVRPPAAAWIVVARR